MTREEAITELRLLRANVERLLSSIREDTQLSQKWRNEKIGVYGRRIEALTFAIETLEDLMRKT